MSCCYTHDLSPRLVIEESKPSKDLYSVADSGCLEWYRMPTPMLCRGKEVAKAYAEAWGKWWLQTVAPGNGRVIGQGDCFEVTNARTMTYRFWARVQLRKFFMRRETVVVEGQQFYREVQDFEWLPAEREPRTFTIYIQQSTTPRVLVEVLPESGPEVAS